MDLENTIIEKDVHEEPLWITAGKYALFMSYGKVGIDAMALYMHYQFTATLQATNSVWAGDRYCRQGLDWGRDRFEKAKALLIELGIIQVGQRKESSGKFGKTYIKIKRGRVDLEPSDLDRLPENPQADKTACGQTATNALSNNSNALAKKRNTFSPPSSQEVQTYLNSKNITEFTGDEFCASYEAKGWKIGNNKMVNWKAAVATWFFRDKRKNAHKTLWPVMDNQV